MLPSNRLIHDSVSLLVALAILTTVANAEPPYPVGWIRQLGLAGSQDSACGVASASNTKVIIAGVTEGNLGGQYLGRTDGFVSQYTDTGTWLWTSQFGTSGDDICYGVVADPQGNSFSVGFASGTLGGAFYAGDRDALLVKLDPSGTVLWTRLVGTPASDEGLGIALGPSGSVFITGFSESNLAGLHAGGLDAFLCKYDSSGNQVWKKQIGTASTDCGYGVAADNSGNVYVGGETRGSLGGANAGIGDVFVSKYDSAGGHLWTCQFGTSGHEYARSLTTDSGGNIYVAGCTSGELGVPKAGAVDVFLSKLDGAGNILWTRQLGTEWPDEAYSVTADSQGNVFVAGQTYGSLGGPSAGNWDAFVAKYDANGNLTWTSQFGTGRMDLGKGVATDAQGNAYVCGMTGGELGGPNPGEWDAAFVLKLVVPEPGSLCLLALGGLAVIRWSRREGQRRRTENAEGS